MAAIVQRGLLGLCLLAGVASSVLFAASSGAWLRKVPEAARVRTNPVASDPNAVAAGGKLFRHDCASCHGEDARGRGSRPSLHSQRVHQASDGEIEWLLTNGSLAHGMPSWSRLPEMERWQIVSYLRTLPVEESR